MLIARRSQSRSKRKYLRMHRFAASTSRRCPVLQSQRPTWKHPREPITITSHKRSSRSACVELRRDASVRCVSSLWKPPDFSSRKVPAIQLRCLPHWKVAPVAGREVAPYRCSCFVRSQEAIRLAGPKTCSRVRRIACREGGRSCGTGSAPNRCHVGRLSSRRSPVWPLEPRIRRRSPEPVSSSGKTAHNRLPHTVPAAAPRPTGSDAVPGSAAASAMLDTETTTGSCQCLG
jgi:hypothetical protein